MPSLSFLGISTATARGPLDRDQRTATRQGHPLAAPGDGGADEFQAALPEPFLAMGDACKFMKYMYAYGV